MTNEITIKEVIENSGNKIGFEMAINDIIEAEKNRQYLRANRIYLLLDKMVSSYRLPFNAHDIVNFYKIK